MCIGLAKPADIKITKSVLKTCFENNPHGSGIARINPNGAGVIIEKGFFHFREFWTRYRLFQNEPLLIHFRVATSANIDKRNCHPWRIDKNHALIHNGKIQDKIGIESEDTSDTGLFVKHILRPTFQRNQEVWKTDAYKYLIERSIGDKNKMVIMDNKGEFVIFNEKLGEWVDGVWFSNDTYKNERKNLDKLAKSWIETREDGRKLSVVKKGNETKFKLIKNEVKIGNNDKVTIDSKISNFVQKQTGVFVGTPIVPISKLIDISNPNLKEENYEKEEFGNQIGCY